MPLALLTMFVIPLPKAASYLSPSPIPRPLEAPMSELDN
jgi:hypothetical protein